MTHYRKYHEAVMAEECLRALDVRPEGTYVDATFGGGGHSETILSRLKSGRLYAFDQDADSTLQVRADERLVFIQQNFRFVANYLKMYKAPKINGLLADLGISSHQIDTIERGFTFRGDASLDMRMDRNQPLTAANVVNDYEEAEITRILREYGELHNAGKVASAIIAARKSAPIKTTGNLTAAIAHLTPERTRHKFLAKVFQSLRIEVNGELEALKSLLMQCENILAENGRIAFITYHSLEDRLVKNYIRSGNFEGTLKKDFYGNVIKPFEAINRKPILPSPEELERNNRSRSAKLRVAKRVTTA